MASFHALFNYINETVRLTFTYRLDEKIFATDNLWQNFQT